MTVCPLVFAPIFLPKVWGGRNLASLLGKCLPVADLIGESWECADLEGRQSIVARGPAKGRTLHQLVTEWGAELLGRVRPVDGRFPLLIKFLDAMEPLSIQVHPDAAAAELMGLHYAVKHEAWHVLHAAPGAMIYRGLKSDVTPEVLRTCVMESPQDLPSLMKAIPARVGDTCYLPAGTLHALGAGVVVAEVQTPSDVTFRLYDWGRVRPDIDAGMHIEQALASVRYGVDFSPFEKRSHLTSVFTTVTQIVSCPSFKIEKIRFVEEFEQDIPYAEMVCWIVLEGQGEIGYELRGVESFSRGDVVVLPAALKKGRLRTRTACTLLEVTIPTPSDLADYARPDASVLKGGHDPQVLPIQININPRGA